MGGIAHLDQVLADAAHLRQQFARHHDGVDAVVGEAGMRLVAGHFGGEGDGTLVGVDHLHRGGLADDDGARLRQVVAQMGNQRADTLAAHLLVAGQGQVDGRREPGLEEVRHLRKADRKEALHVAGATAEETILARREFEGIAGPGLAVDRHHVGVARQHDAAGNGGADGGEQVGLAVGLVVDAEMRNAPAVEIVLDEFDQGNVAITARRVEGDEAGQHLLGGIGLACHDLLQLMACFSCGLSSEKGGISTLMNSPEGSCI